MSLSVPVSAPARSLDPLSHALRGAIQRVVDSGRWLKGMETAAFEEEFAEYCGAGLCLGVGNGTDGLELALRAASAAGREVVTVANAGGYTTTACRLVGATPVYVDVDDARLTMNIEAAVNAVGPNTRVVVATHLYGNVVDVELLTRRLAQKGRSDVLIVEDCSQAHGASVGGRRVGSLGDMAVFSFYPTKNLGAFGDAGAVVCRDAGLHDELAALHQYGWTSRYRSTVPYGRNSRMDEVQAAVLRVKLPHLDEWNDERRRIVGVYGSAISGTDLRLATDHTDGGVAHLAVFRCEARDDLRNHLASLAIGSDVHYPVLDCDQESQRGLHVRRETLSCSESARDEIVTLPCFPGMMDAELAQVVDGLASFTSRGASEP